MSRHTQENIDYTMAYGDDLVFGLFIQIFDKDIEDEDESLIVNLDQLEDKLTPQKMVETAEYYGFRIQAPEETIQI